MTFENFFRSKTGRALSAFEDLNRVAINESEYDAICAEARREAIDECLAAAKKEGGPSDYFTYLYEAILALKSRSGMAQIVAQSPQERPEGSKASNLPLDSQRLDWVAKHCRRAPGFGWVVDDPISDSSTSIREIIDRAMKEKP